MIERLENPHLPTGQVVSLICGKMSREQGSTLSDAGIEQYSVEELPRIEQALCFHADLAICPLPGFRIRIQPSQINLSKKLISLGYSVIMEEMEAFSPYPNDRVLNYIHTQQYIISTKNECSTIVEEPVFKVFTKQGYSKCSVAPVAEQAILTDDPAIANEAKRQGMDVCLVEKGDIYLHGYPYGLIGGSCGKLSKDILAFCGKLESHRNSKQIKSFLRNYNIYHLDLSHEQLTDVGSIIPIMQRKDN